ncbi:unnamed protein product [Pieris macdunnoughi]|uniref:Uncharacterized protein n=2 Tax=Pieris macdunnoughi TaxID=345717 RepID=A0A821QRJ6_9NEOP|nr:unnamed protein product [Pieris macdunnoughi]
MLRVTFIFVVFCFINVVLLVKIPDYMKICKRDQSTINECVTDSVQSLRPHLVSGIPEFQVPSIDPFYISEIIAISGELAPLKAKAKNVKVSGASDFTVKNVDVNLDTFAIRALFRFPKLHLEGLYQLDTQILVVPLRGQGNFVADAIKCDADVRITNKIYEMNGTQYIKFQNVNVEIDMKDYRLRLYGLFNGDKTLEEATNEAINQNRGEFLQAMKPYIEKTTAKVLLDTANRIVNSLPLDQIFPKP